MVAIELDFGFFSLDADLFENRIAERFAAHMPYHVKLVQWGRELYGPIGLDLGAEKPVPSIPPGGIAYTRDGGYVCIFFGRQPAWPVEHIGGITKENWKMLLDKPLPDSVIIRKKAESEWQMLRGERLWKPPQSPPNA